MVTSPDSFPFRVIGNKADLADEARAVSSEEARTYCEGAGKMDFLETSASKNQNVEEAFVRLATQALKRQAVMQKQLDEN